LKIYYIVLYILFLVGCATHTPPLQEVEGVGTIEQNVTLYANGIDKGYISTLQEYKKNYYKEWCRDKPYVTKEQAMWAHRVFVYPKYYGENSQIVGEHFYHNMLENANFEDFATSNQKAITLKRVNIRAFPTQRALFLNPEKAGEGYPFDYLQNSALGAFKPVLVSHYSKDRAWVFIESSFAYGWVLRSDIAFIDNQHASKWQDAQQMVILRDKYPVYNHNKDFLFYSQIGQMLPRTPYFDIDKNIYNLGILPFNTHTIAMIIKELQKNIYGWGGMYTQRDCSATVRDFFAPFGIWLPRNSLQQSHVGKIISLQGMDDAKKIETIIKFGIPFETLLYKKGHIVLYVGSVDNKVVIFHNTWGIKTKQWGKEGRYIIAKPVFTTLDFGQNIDGYHQEDSILHHLESMNILTQ